MKTVRNVLLIVLFLCDIGAPLRAKAVSWSPLTMEREQQAAQGIVGKGEGLCLFQSGTADVKKEIRAGDLLRVYREGQNRRRQETGTIRIRAYVGEDYLNAVVVEGAIAADDIAVKDGVASIVLSTRDPCR